MNSVISDLAKYLLDNMYDEITMDTLEHEFYYNRYYLIRAFKSYTGYTIKEFINTVKVLKSIDPLLFTDDTILKIALSNGFNSQEYYSETFQGVIGRSPNKFRKDFKNLEETKNINLLKMKREYLTSLQNYKEELLYMPQKVKEEGYTRKLTN